MAKTSALVTLPLALSLLGACHSGAGAEACCAIETPSCDCFQTGGARRANGQCPGMCDVRPDNWHTTIDDAGCPMLVEIDPEASCLVPPDFGAPDMASRCCPIDSQTCNGGESIGGARLPDGRCQGSAADVPPDNWMETTDDAGCPMLVASDPHASCLTPPDAGI